MKETLMNIALSDIESNPNRDLNFNPLHEEKLVALMASINETGFWSNVIVRPHPEKKGKYQLSYGHHRLESAKRCGIKEAEFVVRNLDDNFMIKMMEAENSEDYRYCPLSLLESCRAVVNALAEGRIASFYKVEDGTLPPEGNPERYRGTFKQGEKWQAQHSVNREPVYLGLFATRKEAAQAYRTAVKGTFVFVGNTEGIRYAPSFIPVLSVGDKGGQTLRFPYNVADISRFLGREVAKGKDTNGNPVEGADSKTRAALDALYLLEVKAINVATIKEMNWSQLIRYVADAKAHRERTVLRVVKTKDEIAKLNAEALRIQAEQKTKEKTIADAKAALVKKLAEAKREGDAKAAKEAKERMAVKEAEAEKAAETFEVKKAALNVKVAEVKQKEVTAKEEDKYLPVRKEADRIVHKLERRDEEAEIKALARRPLNANDRERLRQAALKLGEWYNTWVADLFLPPLSTKSSLAEYHNREEAKRRVESKETK